MNAEGRREIDRWEAGSRLLTGTRIPVRVFPTADEGAIYAAARVARVLGSHASAGRSIVLGLPTGSTPVVVYRELIRRHREAGLDFSHTTTFNLDEYWPMDPTSPHSYHRWMRETFFNHVNVPANAIHLPRGNAPAGEVATMCARYEQQIRDAGGIDLQLLGIGRNGHIAFNEPGSPRDSRTRLAQLGETTIHDAAREFGGEANVPRQAVTMGIGTILEARAIILLAFGAHKAEILRPTLREPSSTQVPASALQGHRDTVFIIDEAAAAAL